MKNVAIPMPLAVGSVHTHLVNEGLRSFVSINVQASDVLDVHSFAVLIGIGATTINPYLAERTILSRYKKDNYLGVSSKDILENYKSSINKGILKTMSKMGISVLSSYRAGYNFEALGLNRTLVADLFPGMPSRISGLRFHEIENRVKKFSNQLFPKIRNGDFAQALMDFGSIICIPKNPKCNICFLSKQCLAYRLNLSHAIPKQKKIKISRKKYGAAFIVMNNKNELILRKENHNGVFAQGTHQFTDAVFCNQVSD